MKAYIKPMIKPKSPRADPKISTTRIFIKVEGSCVSANTQEEPETPTQIPQKMLLSPTPSPAQKIA